MGVAEAVISQFRNPRGFAGRLAGWDMAHRSSNVRRNRWVADVLALAPSDHVLEIGFGPGIAIEAMARVLPGGHVYGVDHSALMVQQAAKRNAAAIADGRVELMLGSVDALPAFDAPLDAIVAVNNMKFWPDPSARLVELQGRLRPGGRIAIVSQPRTRGADAETSRADARTIEEMLRTAGYTDVRVETLDLDPPVVCVIGVNPAGP